MATKNARSILAATILGSSLVFIDSTAVNVALPVFQRDLHADLAAVQWIVEAYHLFLSPLVLAGGPLRRHLWGRPPRPRRASASSPARGRRRRRAPPLR